MFNDNLDYFLKMPFLNEDIETILLAVPSRNIIKFPQRAFSFFFRSLSLFLSLSWFFFFGRGVGGWGST